MAEDHGYAIGNTFEGAYFEEVAEPPVMQVGELIDANPEDIIFTAGATEAINLAICGVVRQSGVEHAHLITVSTEHPAVLDTCHYLASTGVQV